MMDYRQRAGRGSTKEAGISTHAVVGDEEEDQAGTGEDPEHDRQLAVVEHRDCGRHSSAVLRAPYTNVTSNACLVPLLD